MEPELHVQPIGRGAPYFARLRSLSSDNKDVFSSTQLPQVVKRTLSSLKVMQKVPLLTFPLSLAPAPAVAPCGPNLANLLCKPSQ